MTHEQREKSIRSQLNPRDPLWAVTVNVEGNTPETYRVNAPREGLAKTTAMALYRQKLNGRETHCQIVRVK